MNASRRGFMSLLAAIAAAPAALAATKKSIPVSTVLESMSFNRGAATTKAGTCGKILMFDGKGGVSWEHPPKSTRGITSIYVVDEAGFLVEGKPLYVASAFGRQT